MTSKTWKQAERTIAKLLGGTRVPVTGRGRGSAPDIEHKLLSLEVKHWQTLPNWLHDAMEQAEASMKGHQIPTVVLHETGMKYEDSYVVMRLSDVIELVEAYTAEPDIPLNM